MHRLNENIKYSLFIDDKSSYAYGDSGNNARFFNILEYILLLDIY